MGKKHKKNNENAKLNNKSGRHSKVKHSKKQHDLEALKEELQKELNGKEPSLEIHLDGAEELEPEIPEMTKEETKNISKKQREKKTKKEKNNKKNKKENKEKKKSSLKRKIIIRFLQIVFIVIIVFSGIEIIKWNNDNQKTQEILENVSGAVTQEVVGNENGEQEVKYVVDFAKLKATNPDTVAWIRVNNTNVEYPVVKTEDNEFYLTHNFEEGYSKAGWIFADYRNFVDGTDRNLIVYGHNRMDGSMFATLESCLEEEWYTNPENRPIIFMTETEETIYEIFSIYEIRDEEYYIRTDFYSDEAYENFLNTLARRSIYDFGAELNCEDQILTLSTCTNYNNGRIVIHAKKLRNEVEIEEPEPEAEINPEAE